MNHFLNKSSILCLLKHPIPSLLVFETIPSTNDFLLKNSIKPPCVVIAEHQSHARGRRERNWQTPKGQAIALSMSYRFAPELDLSGLSLAIAVMITRLSPTAFLQVKWPNDILGQGKKLAGILIDCQHRSDEIDVIIGIGMNIKLSTSIDNATDWYSVLGCEVDPNCLCAQVIDQLQIGLAQFANFGLSPFLDEWQRHDFLVGQQITMNHQGNTLTGRYCGINAQGELILTTSESEYHLHSGVVNNIRSHASLTE